jgi:hypothetical protein
MLSNLHPVCCSYCAELAGAVSKASDVYMLGGLFYEILTVGKVPFHWLPPLYPTASLYQRRTSADAVPDSSGQLRPGLLDKNVLEAAVIDGVEVPWSVQQAASPGSASRLVEAKSLVERCCQRDPFARPSTKSLSDTLRSLLEGEREVVPKPDVVPGPTFTSLQVSVAASGLLFLLSSSFVRLLAAMCCFPTRSFLYVFSRRGSSLLAWGSQRG